MMGRRQMRGTLDAPSSQAPPTLACCNGLASATSHRCPPLSYLSGTFERLSQVVPSPPEQTIRERVLMVSLLSLDDKTIIRGSGQNTQPGKSRA